MLNLLKQIRRSFILYKQKYIYPKQSNRYGLFGENSIINTPVYYTDQKNVFIANNVKIKSGFKLVNYTGRFIVKKYSTISLNCNVVTGNHIRTVGIPFVLLSSSHVNDIEKDVIIEEDVWVGVNATLLSGCHLGRGCIVGACSMVNREVPPYAVVVGSPAKIIASVFTLEQILEHERFLYPEHERLSKECLIELFDTYFKDKKAIGVSDFIASDVDKLKKTMDRMKVDFENSSELLSKK